MRQALNVASHILIGVWAGQAINDPRYRHGVWAGLILFIAYQVVGAWRKGDQGWPELREAGWGDGLGAYSPAESGIGTTENDSRIGARGLLLQRRGRGLPRGAGAPRVDSSIISTSI